MSSPSPSRTISAPATDISPPPQLLPPSSSASTLRRPRRYFGRGEQIPSLALTESALSPIPSASENSKNLQSTNTHPAPHASALSTLHSQNQWISSSASEPASDPHERNRAPMLAPSARSATTSATILDRSNRHSMSPSPPPFSPANAIGASGDTSVKVDPARGFSHPQEDRMTSESRKHFRNDQHQRGSLLVSSEHDSHRRSFDENIPTVTETQDVIEPFSTDEPEFELPTLQWLSVTLDNFDIAFPRISQQSPDRNSGKPSAKRRCSLGERSHANGLLSIHLDEANISKSYYIADVGDSGVPMSKIGIRVGEFSLHRVPNVVSLELFSCGGVTVENCSPFEHEVDVGPSTPRSLVEGAY